MGMRTNSELGILNGATGAHLEKLMSRRAALEAQHKQLYIAKRTASPSQLEIINNQLSDIQNRMTVLDVGTVRARELGIKTR